MSPVVNDPTQAQAWMEEEVAKPFPNSLDEDALNREIDFDLSQAEETNLIPVGRYPVKIINVEAKVSDKANPYTEMTFQISAGPLKGRKVIDRFMHGGQPVVRIIHLMGALGMLTQSVSDTIKSKKLPKVSPGQFRDRYLWISIVHRTETYQGEPRQKAVVSWTGFEDINKFAPPADDDLFAEAGEAIAPTGRK